MIHGHIEPLSSSPWLLSSSLYPHATPPPPPHPVNQPWSCDRSCRFPTSHWGVNIHPKELDIAVTPDDIMTTWKLINSFIHPQLSLLFISVRRPSLSLLLFSPHLPQIHPSAPHLSSGSDVAHKSPLLSNAIHFPRNTGRRLLQKLGQA